MSRKFPYGNSYTYSKKIKIFKFIELLFFTSRKPLPSTHCHKCLISLAQDSDQKITAVLNRRPTRVRVILDVPSVSVRDGNPTAQSR
jgi:hypothetical protein